MLVEIQVFKAVVQGMAAKIRYLQVRVLKLRFLRTTNWTESRCRSLSSSSVI